MTAEMRMIIVTPIRRRWLVERLGVTHEKVLKLELIARTVRSMTGATPATALETACRLTGVKFCASDVTRLPQEVDDATE